MSVPLSLQAPFAALPVRNEPPKQNIKFRFWHETLIDLMLQHPEWSNIQLAQAVGKTPVTIGYVTRSDMFRARFELRRQEHSERISYSIIAKTQGIAIDALDQLKDKLADNAVSKKISARDLGEIAAEALDRIGLGPKPADIHVNTTVQQNNTTVTVSGEALLRARQKLRNNESVLQGGSPGEAAALPLRIEAQTSEASFIEVVATESVRSPIIEELMSLGDDVQNAPEGEQAPRETPEQEPAASVAPVGREEGEG